MNKKNDQAPINTAIEDALAHASEESERVLVLRAWIMLGAEYLAREAGRSACMDFLHGERSRIRDAEPTKDWPL